MTLFKKQVGIQKWFKAEFMTTDSCFQVHEYRKLLLVWILKHWMLITIILEMPLFYLTQIIIVLLFLSFVILILTFAILYVFYMFYSTQIYKII